MARRTVSGFLLVVLSVAVSASAPPAAKRNGRTQVDQYLEHVKHLAAPEMQGRGAGTPGLERAADYIASQFRTLGLKPAGDNSSYLQGFPVTTAAKPGSNTRLSFPGQGDLTPRSGSDYIPLSFSLNGQLTGGLAFAGYGITAPEFQYDDYAGLDVRDRIVVVLRYEPPSFSGSDKAHKTYTHHAHLVSKAINARNHGARAVLLLNGEPLSKEGDRLIRFGTVAGPDNSGILMMQIKNELADRLLNTSGKSAAVLQDGINKSRQPSSFLLPEEQKAEMQVDIERAQATVNNVVGYLPGRTKEYVVIGAHYDHLGLGGEGSLSSSGIGQVHPGADDNASGTAGLLELARLLSAQKTRFNRGVLFIAFAGEEIGLLGSSWWVNHPTLPLQDAAAMINLDMIGRLNGSKLYIGGTGTGSTFDSLLKQAAAGYPFKIDYSQNGFSASDHTSFAAKSIPVLFFFSGLHGDYHKPSDTWDKIRGDSAVQVVDMVDDVAVRLLNAAQRPEFQKVQEQSHAGSAPGSSENGYGPWFGSIPDFAPVPKGVPFSDVRPGSPAAKAGLRAGDVLIQFGDKPVNNLYDFTFALRSSKVGDKVTVRVLRGGQEVTAEVTLEPRP